ncbi:hypothetical protein [Bradyrhizobium sp. RDM4]|uniref:hypothetical protein n=1 Tax=Bradyrhizobium sp. RDM4 TaxID=3378765 RepID=UPI0038FCDCED
MKADAVVIAMRPRSLMAAAWWDLPAVFGQRSPGLVYDTGTDVKADAFFPEYQEESGTIVSVDVFPSRRREYPHDAFRPGPAPAIAPAAATLRLGLINYASQRASGSPGVMSDILYLILTLSDYLAIFPTWEVAMSDGPFRNAELPSSWKRYGRDLVSDAASREERAAQACHSMVGDVDMKTFSPLLDELKAHADRPQMDLDPVTAVETIFETHPTSPLMDTLQRHLIANLRDQIRPEKALDQALNSTAKEWISTTKNRLDEECIRARELGDMSREDYSKGIERNRETFAAIKPSELCNALITGNKRAFRQAVQKKAGVDEGPEE